jgi:cytochrome c556
MIVLPRPLIAVLPLTIALAFTPVHADGQRHKHGVELIEEIKKKVSNQKHAAVIAKRRDAMHDLGNSMKKIAGNLRRENGNIADVKDAAINIEEIGRAIPDLFPPGTGMATYNGITGAKPAIYSDATGFKTASLKMSTLASDFVKAINAGASKSDLGKKFGMIGRLSCGGCHRIYREKL